jgi:hypothetical protein
MGSEQYKKSQKAKQKVLKIIFIFFLLSLTHSTQTREPQSSFPHKHTSMRITIHNIIVRHFFLFEKLKILYIVSAKRE